MPPHWDDEVGKEFQPPSRTPWSEHSHMLLPWESNFWLSPFLYFNPSSLFQIQLVDWLLLLVSIQRKVEQHTYMIRQLTSLSCSDDRLVKQLFLIRFIATSVPLHLPWYTVPKLPEPSSRSSSRSAFFIIWQCRTFRIAYTWIMRPKTKKNRNKRRFLLLNYMQAWKDQINCFWLASLQ